MKLRVECLIVLIVLFFSLPLALTAQDSGGRTTNPALVQTQVFNVAVRVNGPNGAADGHNAPTVLHVRGGQGGTGGVNNANGGMGAGIWLRAGDGGGSSQDGGAGGDITLIAGAGGGSSELPGSGGSIRLRPGAPAPFCGIICSDPGNIILGVRGRGGVGVGTSSPSHTLEIVAGGSTLADSWSVRSSRRFKSNIQPLQGALDKVQRLQGVSYERKDDGKREIGVVAEDVVHIVPEVVSRDPKTHEVQGVDYSRLAALLIEAIKSQEAEIWELQIQIGQLKSKGSGQ